MKYDFYLNKGDYSGSERKLVDESFFEANQTFKIRQTIKYRSIIYYLRINTGLSRVIDGDYPRIYLGMGDNISNVIKQINSLFDYFEPRDVAKELMNYPYIAHSLPKFSKFYIEPQESIEKYYCEHPNFPTDINFIIEDSCIKRFTYFVKSVDQIDFQKEIPILVSYADNIIKELSHFKISINRLKKKQVKQSGLNMGLSPKLDKALLIGGYFVVKAAVKIAARSIGTDADINFDFSDSNVEIPDFDFDITTDADFSNISMDNNEGGDNPYLISFGNAPNNGTYIKSNEDVKITCAGGPEKGTFDVYFHNGSKFIDFQNQWIKINGKNGFYLNGNYYTIRPA